MPERVFYCFGEYRLDAQSRALYRGNELVRLEPKIADMLLFLVERHGLVVSKDELMQSIWQGTIVEETAIRRNISLMRSTLDATDMDRFVETLPRQGYRFCAAVHVESQGDVRGVTAAAENIITVDPAATSTETREEAVLPAATGKRRLMLWINLSVLLLAGGLLLFHFAIQPRLEIREFTGRQLTTNSEELPILTAAISPDGNMIAFADETQLFVSDTKTVERHVLPLPREVVPSFLSWMPDSIHLLVTSINPDTQESSLWSVPVLGGSAELLLHDVHMASASADGERIVFIRHGNQLWIADANGTNAKLFATVPGNMDFGSQPQFSADGRYIVDRLLNIGSPGSRIEARNVETGAVSLLYESSLPIPDFWLTGANELLIAQQPGRTSNSSQLLATTVNLEKGTHSVMRVVATSSDGLQGILNTTRDGKMLVTVVSRFYAAAYVADLAKDGNAITNVRRLTMNDSHNLPTGWIAGTHNVLLFSNRTGHFGIFQQAVDATDARALVSDEHDYVRPAVTADGKSLFYFMTQDISKQRPDMETTLLRQPMSGGVPHIVDAKPDFYRGMRCATTMQRCVIAEHDEHTTTFYLFDPVKGRGDEVGRTNWIPQTNAFSWDISHDGTRIAFIDSTVGTNDIGIMDIDAHSVASKHMHVDSYDVLATLYWDARDQGFYVGTFGVGGEVVRLMHIGLDGSVQVLRQQVDSWYSWAIPSDDGRYLVFQKFARKSNIWLMQRQ